MTQSFTTAEVDAGKRLDHFLHQRMPEHSRSRLQEWIKNGHVRVNGEAAKASAILRGRESITVEPAERPPLKAFAEDIPVEVLYCDEDLIAVNKPAGVVVHSGAGRHSGTLVNALLHHFSELSNVSGDERPGIVHRLDRETSGVLLVARTDTAHRNLAAQFADRKVRKTYIALVQGVMKQDKGRIEAKITRDPVRRIRMTARLEHGRSANTEYQVLKRFSKHTLLEVRIGTGRTHQIRVHLASVGHAVAGDKLYGGTPAQIGRFFLHAQRIEFESPSSGRKISIEAPLAPELQDWLASLM